MKITLNTNFIPAGRRDEIESLIQGNSEEPEIVWLESPSPYAVVGAKEAPGDTSGAIFRSGALEDRIRTALHRVTPSEEER